MRADVLSNRTIRILLLAAALPLGRVAALDDVTAFVRDIRRPAGGGGFQRADSNQDGRVDIADAVSMLDIQFGGKPSLCDDALDVNDDGQGNIADPIYLLSYLFAGGPAPLAPFGACGPDPTGQDPLGCAAFRGCPAGGEGYFVKLSNTSKLVDVLAPLIAVVESVSPPGARILNSDGLFKGKPYFEYTSLLAGGALPAGGETPEKSWGFLNPGGALTFQVRIYGSPPAGGWLPGSDPIGEDPPAPGRKAGRMDGDGAEYEIRVPGIFFRRIRAQDRLFHELHAANCGLFNSPGRPGIPIFTQFLGVPRGAKAVAKLSENAGVLYKGIVVYPTQHTPADNRESPPPPFVLDEKLYQEDRLYPESLVTMSEVEIRGLRVAVVQVALARTDPRRGELHLYPEIDVRVSFEDGQGKAPADFIDPADRTLESESLAGVLALNHEVFRVSRGAIAQARVEREHQDLYIVAPREFEEAAERLAEWKRDLGFATTVGYTDTIGMTAADIQGAIRTRYLLHRISYVLLLGDAEFIPPNYHTHHPTDHSYRRIGTDLYYATMGGAGDFMPDVAIGRIPASTLAEADLVVDKIIAYEGSPPRENSFYARALLAAYFQDDDPRDGTEDRWFARTSEEIHEFFDDIGKGPERIYRTPGDVDPRWWNNGTALPAHLRKPGFPWDGDAADISAGIHDGAFLVVHRDHASWEGWGDPPYAIWNVNNLTNGALTPVVLSINCQSGWFDRETDEEGAWTAGESFAETFLLRAGGGAAAVVAATRNSRSGTNDHFTKGMIDCIWPDMLPDFPGRSDEEAEALAGSREMGWVLAYGKYRVLAQYPTELDGYGLPTDNPDGITRAQCHAEIFHLVGDPTMRIRIRSPFLMSATLRSTDPYVTDIRMPFPPEFDGATLGIIHGGRVVGKGLVTDLVGKIYMPSDQPLRPDSDTYVVATKDNAIPFKAKLSFTPSCALYCLEVPLEPAGKDGIADFGAPPDGRLIPLSSTALNGTGRQSCCASEIAATSAFLFATHNQSGKIEMMSFGPDGALSFFPGSPFAGKGVRPTYLAVNEAGDRLLATTGDDLVDVFAITKSGLIPVAGSPVAIRGTARDIETFTYKLNTFVYVCSTASPKAIFIYRLLATGLESLGTFDLEKLGARRPGYDAIAIARGFLFVRDLDGGIFAFDIDEATGALALVKGSPFPAGLFCTAMGISRDGENLYAAAAFSGRLPEIACFRIEADGGLTRIGSASSPLSVADLVTDCSDTILYAASQAENSIARYAIQSDGTLKPLGTTPAGNTDAAPAALWAR